MSGYQRKSTVPTVAAAWRAPRWLTVLVVLATISAASITWAQAPLVAPATSAQAPAAVAIDQKLIAEAKTGSEIMANLTHLSDVIGPRLTGSAALKRANEWTAAKMKSYGLENVRLEPWELPVGWERGTASARIVAPDNGRTLHVAAWGWTPGTNGKVVGDVVVINANTPEELKAYKGKLKNAIVLRGPPANVRPITEQRPAFGGPPAQQEAKPAPGGQPQRPAGFDTRPGRQGGASMALRREMMELCRSEGVAAMLQDAGKPHGLLTMSGGWGGRDRASGPDPLPALVVAHEHYALLYRLATRPAPATTRLEIEITNKFIPGPITVYNTVGEIRGSEKPDEFVVLGAHLDS
jgi:hypothetical protein